MIRVIVQTNVSGEHHFWLLGSKSVLDHKVFYHAHHGSDRLLSEFVTFLGRRRPNYILVVRGPGPFTAVRAALVVMNTLGWLWDVPVIGIIRKKLLLTEKLPVTIWGSKKSFTGPVRPWYGRQPNITKSKKRR